MRTPKPLYAQQRRIYHPELMSCPSCGDLLVGCNYLKWDKIVQTLKQVLSIASRPGQCPNPECAGHAQRLLSAQGQGIAPASSTYGYDVLIVPHCSKFSKSLKLLKRRHENASPGSLSNPPLASVCA